MSKRSFYRPRVLIFAKEPLPGRVRTRLGRLSGGGIGMVEAAGWYRRQSHGLARRLARDPRWESWIAVSPDAAGLSSRFWPRGLKRWAQRGGDLGARMRRAFREFPPGPLVIVGADIPGVAPRHIASAFRALGAAEAVFGPADDGGYWLVGLRRARRAAPPGLFDGVRWSSESTLVDSVESLRGERHALIDRLRDVDGAADLPGSERARYL